MEIYIDGLDCYYEAMDYCTSNSRLEELSNHREYYIRAAVMCNKHTHIQILEKLCWDSDHVVRENI